MPNHEIPGVTIVVGEGFGTPLTQFERALEGKWYPAVITLYERYHDPALRSEFLQTLFPDCPIRVTEEMLDERWKELEAEYKAKTAKGGTNNNNRFRKT